MCRHVTPVAGTSAVALKQSKNRKSPAVVSNEASSSSHSSTQNNPGSSTQSSGLKSMETDRHARKAVAKGVDAKDEKQRLLAAMLKASTQQPAKKITVIAGSPKKEAAATPAKTPKKSLFSFLNSL